jgi:hypothetical protein
MSIGLVSRFWNVDRRFIAPTALTNRTFRVSSSRTAIAPVGRLRVFVEIAYRYQVKAIGYPNLATNYGRSAGV